MNKMTRRGFLTLFKAAPLVAVPSVAISSIALSESEKATEKINDIALNGNNNIIQNCTFTMSGNLQLRGDYQTISYCNMMMNPKTEVPAIQVKGPEDYSKALDKSFSANSLLHNK